MQAEVRRVIVQVLQHLTVGREICCGLGERKIGEDERVPGGVGVQRAVHDATAVGQGFIVVPQSTDL